MELGLKGQEIGKMLGMLLDVVHKSPREYQKALMKKAMGFQEKPYKSITKKRSDGINESSQWTQCVLEQ